MSNDKTIILGTTNYADLKDTLEAVIGCELPAPVVLSPESEEKRQRMWVVSSEGKLNGTPTGPTHLQLEWYSKEKLRLEAQRKIEDAIDALDCAPWWNPDLIDWEPKPQEATAALIEALASLKALKDAMS